MQEPCALLGNELCAQGCVQLGHLKFLDICSVQVDRKCIHLYVCKDGSAWKLLKCTKTQELCKKYTSLFAGSCKSSILDWTWDWTVDCVTQANRGVARIFWEGGQNSKTRPHPQFYFDCGLWMLLAYISAYDRGQKYWHYHCMNRKIANNSFGKTVNYLQASSGNRLANSFITELLIFICTPVQCKFATPS